jgi:methyl-accepting chemotaxis protein
MASGRLRFLYGDFGPPRGSADFSDARYVAVVQPTARSWPAQTPQGSRFAPRSAGGPRSSQAFRGTRDQPGSARIVNVQVALGAAPIFNADGQPVAVAIVSLPTQPIAAGQQFWPLAFFGVASVLLLVGASVFALIAASIVGYLLSRRLVGRLEQLGRASESLRAGDLTTRVAESGSDEVTELQASFNDGG